VGGEAKAAFLLDKKQDLAQARNQVIAMGDGANDLLMMKAADLGIAYRAKPAVQAQANCTINYSDLEAVLALLER
ncbi:MAG: HAD hydrolase family protein, partial [Gammaproteobacteria bacterium]|nr:HAD hydrolase family protein [Gammaproteobacteria bacterium]